MPELPDVEIFKKYFDATSLHQNIREIKTTGSRVYKSSSKTLKNSLEGHSFDHTSRVGKYLFAQIKSNGFLVLHFGMTGEMKYFKKEEEKPDYIQLLVSFTNGYYLAYVNKRKLGKIDLAECIDDFCKNNNIGPDAGSVPGDTFIEIFSKSRAMIKSSLMDQSQISGLGNIYTDEILYQSQIHPETGCGDLGEDELNRIYTVMHRVLDTAIRNDADPAKLPQDYLLPNRAEGNKCPKCKGKIKKIRVGGRSTYYCESCQKKH